MRRAEVNIRFYFCVFTFFAVAYIYFGTENLYDVRQFQTTADGRFLKASLKTTHDIFGNIHGSYVRKTYHIEQGNFNCTILVAFDTHKKAVKSIHRSQRNDHLTSLHIHGYKCMTHNAWKEANEDITFQFCLGSINGVFSLLLMFQLYKTVKNREREITPSETIESITERLEELQVQVEHYNEHVRSTQQRDLLYQSVALQPPDSTAAAAVAVPSLASDEVAFYTDVLPDCSGDNEQGVEMV